LYVILPFEREFFKRFAWEAHYVGNPVLDAVKAYVAQNESIARSMSSIPNRTIALLPGSRTQELKRIIPLMARVVRKFPQHKFAVAAVNNLDASLYAALRDLENVELVFEDTYNLLLSSGAAIVTSGTATLETALFKVPQVVVYKANAVSYWLAKFLVKVEYISLVNLIAGRQVVVEFIQSEASVENVAMELSRLISDAGYRAKMIEGYEEVIRKLDTGSASENAARLMVEHAKKVIGDQVIK
jgi:lipid-A-disaccharide synthase